MRNKESLEKIRSEYEKVLQDKISEDPSLSTASRTKQLSQAVSVDSAFEYEYMSRVIMEGLRF